MFFFFFLCFYQTTFTTLSQIAYIIVNVLFELNSRFYNMRVFLSTPCPGILVTYPLGFHLKHLEILIM